MAKVVAGMGTSHVPAVGAAFDHGKLDEPYWQKFAAGVAPAQEWMEKVKPDVCIVVYNRSCLCVFLRIHRNVFDWCRARISASR